MKMTQNFHLSEFYRSNTADRLDIDNIPPSWAIPRLQLLAETLQELRDHLSEKHEIDVPITVTSGYRSPKLNKAIPGSSRKSHHMQAYAADFVVKGFSPHEVIMAIIECGIEFDQAINEFDRWVHLSIAPELRGEILHARRNSFGRKVFERLA